MIKGKQYFGSKKIWFPKMLVKKMGKRNIWVMKNIGGLQNVRWLGLVEV